MSLSQTAKHHLVVSSNNAPTKAWTGNNLSVKKRFS
jgi:hypothetical protein